MGQVVRELEYLRHRLLDLSLHNRLLNYRAGTRRSLEIIDEIPTEIFDLIVLNERTMYFKPESGDAVEEICEEFDGGEPSRIWKMPGPDVEVADRHRDRYLQTSVSPEQLQKTLFYIHKESQSVVEEQGYTVLYLALGFLEWFDDSSPDVPRQAPLVLIPVELYRPNIGSQFRIRWTGEELIANLSLKARLRDSQVELPDLGEIERKNQIDDYLADVATAVGKKSDWQVISKMVLGFFSFTKFVMYKDLETEALPDPQVLQGNQILHSLFERSEFAACNERPDFDAAAEWNVVDADPSQLSVVEMIGKGNNLLVEGPPGTGKSQTILNLIADRLAAGKTVLFVSEKMAALEVVKKRLDHVGLGGFCLELHSRKSTRKQLLKQLEETLRMDPPQEAVDESNNEELVRLRNELDEYIQAVHEPFSELGQTPYELLGELELAQRYFDVRGRATPPLNFLHPETHSAEELREALRRIQELGVLFDEVRPLKDHPFHGCDPVEMFDDDLDDLRGLLSTTMTSLEEMAAAAEHVRDYIDSTCSLTIAHIHQLAQTLDLILLEDKPELTVLQNSVWGSVTPGIQCLLQHLEDFQRQQEKWTTVFRPEACHADVQSLMERTDLYTGSFMRFFKPGFYRLLTELKHIYKAPKLVELPRIQADLALLQVGVESRKQLDKVAAEIAPRFGSYWQGEASSVERLSALAGWLHEIHQLLGNGVLSDTSIELLAEGIDRERISRLQEELTNAEADFDTHFVQLAKKLNFDDRVLFSGDVSNFPLEKLLQQLTSWIEHLDSIPQWNKFIQRLNSCRYSMAAPLLEVLTQPEIEGDDLIPMFHARLFGQLLKLAVKQRPVLRDFDGDLHQKKIAQFRHADEKMIQLNRHRLINKLYAEMPRISYASTGSQAGVLNAEFNRKRGHMPIRRLMLNCGDLIQHITPCFMMSPLSVAQFLPPGEVYFDLVIFDEASQVRPEEAVGAFVRARQLLVMGDSKQLPPTSFFDHITADLDEHPPEDYSGAVDMESLLNLCRGRIPEHSLQWHYRSRHHSLIAVSNQESYDNRLLAFPSPFDKHPFMGLHFQHLPDTVYDRGRTRMNRLEAQAVADAVIEHFQTYPHKSLGVGTFNSAQQQAIQQEIELRMLEKPELEEHFTRDGEESFFVKNLETIQGDERDVIYVSIGYGFDAERRLSLNFGPVNQDGGERRLNVLITRARERCVVFANFTGEDLPVHTEDETASRGVRYLKVFLQYAQKRHLATNDLTIEDNLTDFERVVCDFLNANNFPLRVRVGCPRFSLDMAVISPTDANTYLIGIECDGNMYNSSVAARERDRLRSQLLESMGWKLHRVWSTDWFRDHRTTSHKLLSAIGQAAGGTSPLLEIPEELEIILRPGTDRSGKEPEIPVYEECASIDPQSTTDLTEASPAELVQAVLMVVKTESPVHLDDVIHRITDLRQVRNVTKRLNNLLTEAVLLAVEHGPISIHNQFLWANEGRTVQPRKRSSGAVDLDRICDLEIAAGVEAVLKRQFATPATELAKEVCYLFGFKRAGEEHVAHVLRVIEKLVATGALLAKYGKRLALTGKPMTLPMQEEVETPGMENAPEIQES